MRTRIHIPIAPGIGMPMIGFGTWQIPADKAENLVSTAIKAGYNHIDCAQIYENETEIGKCFSKLEDRKDVYVTSKLWCTDHEPSRVPLAIQTTLDNLRLDYLDMYLIHNPCRIKDSVPIWYSKGWVTETWREMIKLKESGKAKHIGVSNFTTKKLEWLMDEDDKPSNNQVELHPYLRQDKLVEFCKANGIVATAYSPLGCPALPSFMPKIMKEGSPVLLKDAVIQEIALRHKATPAQVLLKWGIDRGTPVLVKSSNEVRMAENLNSLKLQLSDEDICAINKITTKCRYLTSNIFCPSGHTVEEFWDGEYYN